MEPGGHTAPLPAGSAGDDFRAGFGTFDTALATGTRRTPTCW